MFNYGIWFKTVKPIIAISLAYVSTLGYRFLTEEKLKKKYRHLFARYVSQQVVDHVVEEIIKDPTKLKLGGQRKELTILFSDIIGFTGMSEKMHPEEVVSILNEYFDKIVKVVFKYNGTLDKYIGDGIMVIYGAPRELEDHAKYAVFTALEMIEEVKKLNEKWALENKPQFKIGVGINTGEVVIGHIGSLHRLDYTTIGDHVNIAARIETLTRTYDSNIIISSSTYEKIKEIVDVRRLGKVQVKGKEELIEIYEVIGKKAEKIYS
jgi:adenylate cyclase